MYQNMLFCIYFFYNFKSPNIQSFIDVLEIITLKDKEISNGLYANFGFTNKIKQTN